MSTNPPNPTKNKIKSELFKFVSLTKPKMGLMVSYPASPKYDAQRYAKEKYSFYHDYTSKIKTAENIEDRIKISETLIKKHKNSNYFFKGSTSIRNFYLQLFHFHHWCSNNKMSNNAEMIKYLQSLSKKTLIEFHQDSKNQSLAWDNYFYHINIHTQPEMVPQLGIVLRAYHIISLLAHRKEVNLEKIFRATISVPKDIIFSIYTTEAPERQTEENSTATPSRTEQLQKRRELYIETKEVLVELYNGINRNPKATQLAEKRAKKDQEITSIDMQEIMVQISMFRQEHLEQIATELQGVLKELRIHAGKTTFLDAINRLTNAINQTNSQLGSLLRNNRKAIKVGSSFIIYDEQEHQARKGDYSGGEGGGWQQSYPEDDPFFSIYENHKYKDARLNISIGDFKKVEQELECYKAGEIAHIENVLKGEEKIRETRRLQKTEERYTFVSESSEEEERDVQSTDKFEMEKETERIIQSDSELSAGVDVSAKYGPFISVNASADFSTSSSTQESTRQAVSYAKEVTDRARNKIVRKVKESRTTITTKEFEEKNTHTLKAENDHVVGIYRWVDKVYKTRLLNYGKRLMIRFDVLEPASFHLYATMHSNNQTVNLPTHPSDVIIHSENNYYSLSSYKDIDVDNYALWGAMYNVSLPAPPKQSVQVGTDISYKNPSGIASSSWNIASDEKKLVIPAGYNAKNISAVALPSVINPSENVHTTVDIYVGSVGFWFTSDYNTYPNHKIGVLSTYNDGKYEHFKDNEIPISYRVLHSDVMVGSVVITCEATAELMEQWQIKVFEAIMQAYENQVLDAENKMSELEAREGVQINGSNPLYNKTIIQNNLKRSCIELIRYYSNVAGSSFHLPHSHNPNYPSLVGDWGDETILKRPYNAAREGKHINFMEACFEWDQMVYKLHPFYWARKDRWTNLYNLQDNDPLFLDFLKAGSASVLVPVQLGMERELMYFLRTGKLWLNTSVPSIDGTLEAFLDAQLADVDPNGKPEVEECWETRLPTSLVILQKDADGLDETGLPCYEIPCDPYSEEEG